MSNEEIIKLGTALGLGFNEKDNYSSMMEDNTIVFNGINGQRFQINGQRSNDKILQNMGNALIRMGERKKKIEINNVLSTLND